jgi:small subunit ribosomal protein S7e
MSVAARKKIIKEKGQNPDAFELSVAQAFVDIENGSGDLKAEVRNLNFVSAKEVEVSAGRRAVAIFVPYRQLGNFHRIQPRLVRELEKKFSGKHVVIIAQRRILRKPTRNNRAKKQKRPRSRTLTAVHDAILEDMVYPTDIIGKRLRVRLGGKVLKV